jgi:hypothetical protein
VGDLWISNTDSFSYLGVAYGERPDANETTLFGSMYSNRDYEVFKIGITDVNASGVECVERLGESE